MKRIITRTPNLTVLFLVACILLSGCKPAQEKPGLVADANGIRLIVDKVLTGADAAAYVSENRVPLLHGPDRGWQLGVIPVNAQSLTGSVQEAPFICGTITDSGGYARDFVHNAEIPRTLFSIPPAAPTRGYVIVLYLPASMGLKSMNLFPGGPDGMSCDVRGGDPWVFDLQAPAEKDSGPSNSGADIETASLQYDGPGYSVTLDNFRLYYEGGPYGDTLHLSWDAAITNPGGYDLDLSQGPAVSVTDSQGGNAEDVVALFQPGLPSGLIKVGPGMTEKGRASVHYMPKYNPSQPPEWIEVGISPSEGSGAETVRFKVPPTIPPCPSVNLQSQPTCKVWD